MTPQTEIMVRILNYQFENPTVNFIEGQIYISDKNILVASDGDLTSLAEAGSIEKREDAGGIYYYVEAAVDGTRLGVFISLREKKIEWLLLRWLDSPMKGWDDVSEKALKDEYRLLLNLVEKRVRRPPDNKKNRLHIWRFTWGQLEVSYEPRSFDAAIFMKPR